MPERSTGKGRQKRGMASKTSSAGRERLYRALPWILVVAAAALPFLNALSCGLVFDDTGLILENSFVSPDTSWLESISRPYWPTSEHAGLYRPLVSLSYRLQSGISGTAPWPFHAFNILVHIGVCLLILVTLRFLFPRRTTLMLAITLIFAVHPLHTEAVTGVVGRAELLGALFALAGYLAWLRGIGWRQWLATGLCFALAAGSKESVIGWPLLIGAHRLGWLGDLRSYRIGFKQNSQVGRAMIFADLSVLAGLVLYGICRFQVLGSVFGLSRVTPIDNPIYQVQASSRILTALSVMAKGIGLTLWPDRLSADYSHNSIKVLTNWASPAALVAPVLTGAIFLAIRYRQRFGVGTWALAFYLTLLLPVANILFPIGTIMGERLLYLPSLGLIALAVLGVAGVLGLISPENRRPAKGTAAAGKLYKQPTGSAIFYLAVALLSLALLALGGRSWVRNRDWRSDRSLFEAAVAVVPQSAKALANLGAVYSESGEFIPAERVYRRAAEITPQYLSVLSGLGYVLIMKQEYQEAELLLQQACDLYPNKDESWQRIGNLFLEISRSDEALASFERLLELKPESSEGWTGKASAFYMLRKYEVSADAWRKACLYNTGATDLRPYLIAALISAEQRAEALSVLEELISENNNDAALHHQFAAEMFKLVQSERNEANRSEGQQRGSAAAARAVALNSKSEYIGTLVRYMVLANKISGVRELISRYQSKLTEVERDSLVKYIDDRITDQ